ncbi:MAG TPA: (2Fe-2S)-binding protein [Polyangia bacterium]|nr:(2Fe-2S)-binding protein [Polyangia bacterium]
MLVCHCLRVFDRTIKECVRDGACSQAEVTAACGAGSRCGGCRSSIAAIVDREVVASVVGAAATETDERVAA